MTTFLGTIEALFFSFGFRILGTKSVQQHGYWVLVKMHGWAIGKVLEGSYLIEFGFVQACTCLWGAGGSPGYGL